MEKRQYRFTHNVDFNKSKEKTRKCNVRGCNEPGEHRAPKSRDKLNEYYWFCQDHARQYNKSWNYYEGMTDQDVENDRRHDTVWHRPTWNMADRIKPRYQYNVKDGFGVYEESIGGEQKAPSKPPRYKSLEDEALTILDLQRPVEMQEVKARYKELVKKYHPDANGGDKLAEEKFKEITEAYRTLKDCLGG